MSMFQIRTNLTYGDLTISLLNDLGYAQDAFSVLWTVYDSDGSLVSGNRLSAIKKQTGMYYAPFFMNRPNGNYSIKWEIQATFNSGLITRIEKFFILDPSSYVGRAPINSGAIPVPHQGVFLNPTALGRGDLPLFLRNGSGYLQDASTVNWYITDLQNVIKVPSTAATRASVGEYYASWIVNIPGGDYFIVWNYRISLDIPMQAISMKFSIIPPPAPLLSSPAL